MEIEIRQDEIQIHVEQIADKIWSILGQKKDQTPRLLMLHALIGPKQNPYVLRRTAIRTENSDISQYVEKNWERNKNSKYEQNDERTRKLTKNDIINQWHSNALTRYIRHFNRKHTFLHRVIALFSKMEDQSCCIVGNISTHNKNSRKPFYTEKYFKNKRILEWEITSELIELLISRNHTKDFFIQLYNNDWKSVSREEWKELFDFGLYQAYGAVTSNKNEGIVHDNVKDELSLKREKINRLAEYQGGILYFFEFLKARNKKNNDISCSIILKPIEYPSSSSNLTLLAVAIMTPSISGSKIEQVENELSSLGNFITIQKGYDKAYTGLKEIIKDIADERTLEKYRESIAREVFLWSPFEKNFKLFSLWLLYLIQSMSNKIHEGKKLSFYLICGDKSQFMDSPNILFHELAKKDVVHFDLPERESPIIIKRAADKVIEYLSAEHFPWFEDGRYALFWDIGSDVFSGQRHPVGLVALNKSDWRQFIKNILYEKENNPIVPNCAIYTVNDRPKITSVFKVHHKKDPCKQEVDEIIRFKNKRWVIWDNTKRQKLLLNYLKIIFKLRANTKKEESLKNMVDIIIKIAENPEKGGAIVFIDSVKIFKKDKLGYDLFGSMGKPWSIKNMRDEDKIALIAHDGATVNFLSENRLEYRKFLTADEIDSDIIGEVFKYVEKNIDNDIGLVVKEQDYYNGEDYCPLAFKGTRRWSAAITAFHKKVKATVVISQDGDIYLWYVKDKNDLISRTKNEDGKEVNKFNGQKVTVLEMKITGRARLFNMDSGYHEKQFNIFEEDIDTILKSWRLK